jgi:hypothetical protein
MASGDFKITIGSLVWDFSSYGPTVNWGFERNIEYFRFPGTNEKLVLDLLDNEESITCNLRIVSSNVTTQLNAGSSVGASLRSFMSTVNSGTDPADAATLTTILWHTFGTFTVSVKSTSLQQIAGEGNAYSLDVKFLVQSGPV